MEEVADTVDKELDDNMDEVYIEDMVEDMHKAWVALLEKNKVAVVDMEETQLMGLMMVLLEKGESEEVASYPNGDVVEEQYLWELDLVDIHLEH